jgi:hypothetical protein
MGIILVKNMQVRSVKRTVYMNSLDLQTLFNSPYVPGLYMHGTSAFRSRLRDRYVVCSFARQNTLIGIITERSLLTFLTYSVRLQDSRQNYVGFEVFTEVVMKSITFLKFNGQHGVISQKMILFKTELDTPVYVYINF